MEAYPPLEGEAFHVGELVLWWGVRERRDLNRAALWRLMKEPFYPGLTVRAQSTCSRVACMPERA